MSHKWITESHPPEIMVLSSMNLTEKIRLEWPLWFHSAHRKSVVKLFVSSSENHYSRHKCEYERPFQQLQSATHFLRNRNNVANCPSLQLKKVSSCLAHGNTKIFQP